jgi:hypothetical protein
MKSKACVIIVVLVLLVLVAPSNAYYFDFAGSAPYRVVHLHFDGYGDALTLAGYPYIAADALIDFARDYGRTVTRSSSDIAWQIEYHADAYIAGERQHSNPMDIEIN